MEKQIEIELEKQIEPEVHITRNFFISANSLVREETIRKVWIIPLHLIRT